MTVNQDHLMELIGRFARDLDTSLTTKLVVVGHSTRTQAAGYAPGAQAYEAAIRKMVTPTRFTRLRWITATPSNLVFPARRS